MPAISDIRIRDPFVLFAPNEKCYYLYKRTTENVRQSQALGFDAYRGADLERWDGPFPVFRPGPDFWSDRDYWAPEVHQWRGRFYLFASFKAQGACRGTQILAADGPLGPFMPISGGPATPRDWECLDGTLLVDENGSPWIVFCHEWLQVFDGEICALRLTEDLRQTIGRPVLLFRASDAPWVKPITHNIPGVKPDGCYVTDGPFMHRTATGALLMLWSSFGTGGYTQGLARSQTGKLAGPWVQLDPLYTGDGGHGMLFRTMAGELKLVFHSPNSRPPEHACFLGVREVGDTLRMA